jgi:hypothetical protein
MSPNHINLYGLVTSMLSSPINSKGPAFYFANTGNGSYLVKWTVLGKDKGFDRTWSARGLGRLCAVQASHVEGTGAILASPPTFLDGFKAPRGRPDPKNRPNKFRPDCLQVPNWPFCFCFYVFSATRSRRSPVPAAARLGKAYPPTQEHTPVAIATRR